MIRVVLVFIFFNSMPAVSAELWKWNTLIETVRSFHESSYVCFSSEGVDRPYICFNSSAPGGQERLSMVLSAKISGSVVHYGTVRRGVADVA